jgi:hypothetical protein
MKAIEMAAAQEDARPNMALARNIKGAQFCGWLHRQPSERDLYESREVYRYGLSAVTISVAVMNSAGKLM